MRGREIFETSKLLFQKVSEIAKWSAETKLTRAVLPNHSKKRGKKIIIQLKKFTFTLKKKLEMKIILLKKMMKKIGGNRCS